LARVLDIQREVKRRGLMAMALIRDSQLRDESCCALARAMATREEPTTFTQYTKDKHPFVPHLLMASAKICSKTSDTLAPVLAEVSK